MQEMDVLADFLVHLFYTIRAFIIYPYLALQNKKNLNP